jgi:uncharacterized membrane protein (DUF106 family)
LMKKRYRLCFYYYFYFCSIKKSNQKLFYLIIVFFIFMNSISLKIQNLKPPNTVPSPEPFVFQAQLAELCHFVLSLFFDVFNLVGLRSLTMISPVLLYFLCSLLY